MDKDGSLTSPWEDVDFELEIRIGDPRECTVAVRSLASEAQVMLREFLYDSGHNEYLCLSSKAPLVRYLELSRPVEQLPVMPPLGISRMVAGLPGLGQPNVKREKRCTKEGSGVMAVR